MLERTVVIVKPEGLSYLDQITSRFISEGLRIVKVFSACFTSRVLEKLYQDATACEELWSTLLKFLAQKPCRVFILEGDGAIERVVRICGDNMDPGLCNRETIRFQLGVQFAPILVAGYGPFHRNIVHRSRTVEEAARDLILVGELELGALG